MPPPKAFGHSFATFDAQEDARARNATIDDPSSRRPADFSSVGGTTPHRHHGRDPDSIREGRAISIVSHHPSRHQVDAIVPGVTVRLVRPTGRAVGNAAPLRLDPTHPGED